MEVRVERSANVVRLLLYGARLAFFGPSRGAPAPGARRGAAPSAGQSRLVAFIGVEALVGKGLSLSNPDPNSFGVLPWMYMSLGFSL